MTTATEGTIYPTDLPHGTPVVLAIGPDFITVAFAFGSRYGYSPDPGLSTPWPANSRIVQVLAPVPAPGVPATVETAWAAAQSPAVTVVRK